MRHPNERCLGRANVTSFGKSYDIILLTGEYNNGRLAISAKAEGMPFGTVTVNLDQPLEDGEFFVKTWSENEWVPQLLKSGLFVDTGKRVPTGFVEAQVWKLK